MSILRTTALKITGGLALAGIYDADRHDYIFKCEAIKLNKVGAGVDQFGHDSSSTTWAAFKALCCPSGQGEGDNVTVTPGTNGEAPAQRSRARDGSISPRATEQGKLALL